MTPLRTRPSTAAQHTQHAMRSRAPGSQSAHLSAWRSFPPQAPCRAGQCRAGPRVSHGLSLLSFLFFLSAAPEQHRQLRDAELRGVLRTCGGMSRAARHERHVTSSAPRAARHEQPVGLSFCLPFAHRAHGPPPHPPPRVPAARAPLAPAAGHPPSRPAGPPPPPPGKTAAPAPPVQERGLSFFPAFTQGNGRGCFSPQEGPHPLAGHRPREEARADPFPHWHEGGLQWRA